MSYNNYNNKRQWRNRSPDNFHNNSNKDESSDFQKNHSNDYRKHWKNNVNKTEDWKRCNSKNNFTSTYNDRIYKNNSVETTDEPVCTLIEKVAENIGLIISGPEKVQIPELSVTNNLPLNTMEAVEVEHQESIMLFSNENCAHMSEVPVNQSEQRTLPAELFTKKLLNDIRNMDKDDLKRQIINPHLKYESVLKNHARIKLRAEMRKQLRNFNLSNNTNGQNLSDTLEPDECIDSDKFPDAVIDEIERVLHINFLPDDMQALDEDCYQIPEEDISLNGNILFNCDAFQNLHFPVSIKTESLLESQPELNFLNKEIKTEIDILDNGPCTSSNELPITNFEPHKQIQRIKVVSLESLCKSVENNLRNSIERSRGRSSEKKLPVISNQEKDVNLNSKTPTKRKNSDTKSPSQESKKKKIEETNKKGENTGNTPNSTKRALSKSPKKNARNANLKNITKDSCKSVINSNKKSPAVDKVEANIVPVSSLSSVYQFSNNSNTIENQTNDVISEKQTPVNENGIRPNVEKCNSISASNINNVEHLVRIKVEPEVEDNIPMQELQNLSSASEIQTKEPIVEIYLKNKKKTKEHLSIANTDSIMFPESQIPNLIHSAIDDSTNWHQQSTFSEKSNDIKTRPYKDNLLKVSKQNASSSSNKNYKVSGHHSEKYSRNYYKEKNTNITNNAGRRRFSNSRVHRGKRTFSPSLREEKSNKLDKRSYKDKSFANSFNSCEKGKLSDKNTEKRNNKDFGGKGFGNRKNVENVSSNCINMQIDKSPCSPALQNAINKTLNWYQQLPNSHISNENIELTGNSRKDVKISDNHLENWSSDDNFNVVEESIKVSTIIANLQNDADDSSPLQNATNTEMSDESKGPSDKENSQGNYSENSEKNDKSSVNYIEKLSSEKNSNIKEKPISASSTNTTLLNDKITNLPPLQNAIGKTLNNNPQSTNSKISNGNINLTDEDNSSIHFEMDDKLSDKYSEKSNENEQYLNVVENPGNVAVNNTDLQKDGGTFLPLPTNIVPPVLSTESLNANDNNDEIANTLIVDKHILGKLKTIDEKLANFEKLCSIIDDSIRRLQLERSETSDNILKLHHEKSQLLTLLCANDNSHKATETSQFDPHAGSTTCFQQPAIDNELPQSRNECNLAKVDLQQPNELLKCAAETKSNEINDANKINVKSTQNDSEIKTTEKSYSDDKTGFNNHNNFNGAKKFNNKYKNNFVRRHDNRRYHNDRYDNRVSRFSSSVREESHSEKHRHSYEEKRSILDSHNKSLEKPALSGHHTQDNSNWDGRFVGHKLPIVCMQTYANYLIAASEDGIIYRYLWKTGKLDKTFTHHKGLVTAFIMGNNQNIFSISVDGFMHKFNVEIFTESIESINVREPLQSIDYKWNSVFIGCRGGNIHMFDDTDFKLSNSSLCKVNGNVLAIKASKEGPRKILIVAAKTLAITIRDIPSGLLLRSIQIPENATIYSLILNLGLIIYGTSKSDLISIDFTTGKEVNKRKCGSAAISIKIWKDLLMVASYDGYIYVYDKNTFSYHDKIKGPGKMLLNFDVVENKIIAASKDNVLKIWNICGKLKRINHRVK